VGNARRVDAAARFATPRLRPSGVVRPLVATLVDVTGLVIYGPHWLLVALTVALALYFSVAIVIL